MFRLHRQKSDQLGERFDFKLSNLQALKVPKGWERLSVSIVSSETREAVGKSAKASVWNGSCQWTESFSVSVWLPSYDASKDNEKRLFKVVLFMGPSKLGEATINLVTFTSSRNPVPLSLPLVKCIEGTILQMKVQCLYPKTQNSDEQVNGTISSVEEANLDYDDIDNKSDASDNLSRMSSGSASSNHTDAQFHPGGSMSRETSLSASDSHYGFDSGEGSFGREKFSPQRNLSNATTSHIRRQDSASSNASFEYDSPARTEKPLSSKSSRSRKSFKNEDSHRTPRTFMGSPLRASGSSKELIEAVEVTVEEVRAEARMWEKNARKVMVDFENLQKKFSDELEQKEALELELSESKTECDGLRWEIKELKVSLVEMNLKQNAKDENGNLQKELEGEIKFLNDSNSNLSIQLQKTQESNIELVAILQELEETIETQKKEIADLLAEKSENEQGHEEKSLVSVEKNLDEESSGERNLEVENESLKLKVQELERDCNELTDENLRLLFKLKESQNLQEWEDARSNASEKESAEDELLLSQKKELELRVSDLEHELSVKNGECSSLIGKCTELEVQLQTFRDKVSQLNAEVRKSRAEADEWEVHVAELEQQLEDYKARSEIPIIDDGKLSSGSEDSSEMMKGTYFVTQSDQHEAILNRLVDMRRLVESDDSDKEIMGGADTVLTLDQQLGIVHASLESKMRKLTQELLDKVSEIDKIKAENELTREEMKVVLNQEKELESEVCKMEEERSHLVIANEVLRGKLLEVENDWSSLEAHLSELENENVSLSERICGLEAQLRYLTDEKETSSLALQSSESRFLKLQEDFEELESKLEAQKVDLRGRLSELQKQLLESKEECGYLRIANRKLEATAESVIEECSLLQKLNGDLKAENLELNGKFTFLEAEHIETKRVLDQVLADIEVLREKYNSFLEETILKERAVNAELDALLLVYRRINPSQGETLPLIEDEVSAESEAKVLQLMGELSATKQNQEVLMAEREKLLRLIASFKSDEVKVKNDVRRLELRLKRSEYERTNLLEEISSLRDQLQGAELFKTEALNLRRALDEAKFENERLEASFQVLLGDYDEAKREKDSLIEKISRMEITLRELEACRDRKYVLEERVFRLEGDLTAREALYAEDAELKNELARFRRINSQLQKRVQEYERRARSLKEELKQTNGSIRSSVSEESDISMHEKEEMHGIENITDSPKTDVIKDAANGPEEGSLLKIRSLENELAEALEANGMYKEQLKSLLSSSSGKSIDEERGGQKLESVDKVSSLENELRELRESYFHMSLKYAQGEAEKEELVMKLRAM